jgi:MFS family permease
VRDPLARRGPSVADVLLYLAGVAGIAASITLLFLGMRAVMDVGGFCAEGGPYEIEVHCPEGAPAVTLLGFFLGFASLLLAAWKGSAISEAATSVLFLAWPALFGALGFNFLQYGFDPPGDDPGWAWGWLICGVVFWAMAFGPILLAMLAGMATPPGPAGPQRAARAAPGGPRLNAALQDAWATRDARRRSPESVALPTVEEARASLAATGGAAGDLGAVGIAPGGVAGETGPALVDALERLAELHEAGSLTDGEYTRAKSEILERSGA